MELLTGCCCSGAVTFFDVEYLQYVEYVEYGENVENVENVECVVRQVCRVRRNKSRKNMADDNKLGSQVYSTLLDNQHTGSCPVNYADDQNQLVI
jgi:hypothetical protein